jgi:hypothetical protein
MNRLLKTMRTNLSFSDRLRRDRHSKQRLPKSLPKRQDFSLEPLESRLLLSIDLVGAATYVEQGPGIITNGQTSGIPNNPVVGAVHTLAAHPTNANVLFAGGVNGGVWRTMNATAANPTWTPMTDTFPSLSIGALDMNPANPNVVLAGVGGFASGSFDALGAPRGDTTGALYTTDALDPTPTWRMLTDNIANMQVRAVAARDTYLLVAGSTGVFRSTDGGNNFASLSGTGNLPAGAVLDMFSDPGNTNRYYVAGTFGVFRTDDASAANPTWANVTDPNMLISGATINIRIGVHNDATNNVVYVGVVNGGALASVSFSTNQGGAWTQLDVPAVHPGNQGRNHFSLVADSSDANLVYVGGDTQLGNPVAPQFPNAIGAANFTGNLVRIDRSQAAGAQITPLTDNFAGGNSSPHADSRRMVFSPGADNILGNGDDVLIEADDGGVYSRATPSNNTGAWTSLIGDLGIGQTWSVALDTVNSIVFAGFQDTGVGQQTASNSVNWDESVRFAPTISSDRLQGDGFFQGVDNTSTANSSIHYSLNNTFTGFTRRTYDNNNNPTAISRVMLAAAATPGTALSGLTMQDRGITAALIPFVLNSIDPRLMLIGANSLYEDNNTAGNAGDVIATITPAGMTGFARALAYGGRRAGTDFTQIAWVGTQNGQLFVRGETGGFVQRNTGGAGQISDIVLDPDNWQTAYVLQGNGVFMTTDGGANFTQIGGAATDNLGTLTTELRSLALWDPAAGTTNGNEIVLAGGRGGVYRLLPTAPAGAPWSEYGSNLPNSTVTDIQVYGNALLVGTFGRGAWEVANVSSTIATMGVLQITGDTDFDGEDDTIRLVRDAGNTNLLDVFLNTEMKQYQLSVLQQINVFGLGGRDTLIVDSSNGLINVFNGIRYDGGDSSDNLQLVQTGGPTRTSDTYTVGPDIGSGVSTIAGPGTAGTQIVFFEDLEPVVDLVPALLLEVNATAADNAIGYLGLVSGDGFVTIDEHESLEFSNKTALTINAGAGQDTISLNDPNTPAGLAVITIDGGDPNSGDALIVTGVGGAVSVNTAASTITGATGIGGAVSIGYTGIESLNLPAGIGDLTLTTTAADDTVVVTPGLTTGANSGTVSSSGGVPQIAFTNSGTLTANLAGGNDAMVVNGSSSADTVAVSGAAVAISGRHTVSYTGVEALTVNGNAGSDTFNVTPSNTVAMFIDGGDPIGALPGDLLNIIAGGGSVTFNAGPETDEGSFVVGANQPVSFDHIESFGITGSGPAVINGTNGPDAITVIARDDSTHPVAGVDGIQDFTVSVNTGPELLFINVPSLTINALSGSDQVTLQTPAPNNATWNVNVTVNGGPPAADTDRMIVQTPGTGAESVTYTPTASDGGTLNLTSLTSLVTMTGIEVLSYDGQGDNDSLIIVGTSSDDTIIHTPGANDQAGSFQVNSLLALSYQNLGSTASLTVDGGGGTNDTLVYNGTPTNDSFTIGTAGQVNLNTRLVLNETNVQVLTLNGFAGDDTFTLVPAISASVYSTINLNGGEQASATGDRVYLVGTALADNINISGQVVTLGGRIIKGSGIEAINLDALGGDDSITYNGVSGVTENITVSSSGVEGGGQISVPGVTLVNFKDVKWIDVNGNTPTPTETDTLTFAGTNAVDTFAINLAAAGTTADPILQLQNATGTTTLLTLRNYTNFNTLNVLGLDGTDTFNVTTAASTDPTFTGRNLFVDGGLPSGKKKSTDNLNVFYKAPRPAIIHSVATQNPDAGIVDLNYGTARFVVQYSDVEQVVIRKS